MNPNFLNNKFLICFIPGLLLVIAYFFGLFIPVTNDAGKYAAISKIIYETGDWINLKIHFEPYLQKPPLIFWITTPFYFIFGPTVPAFKIPVLLYSGIAVYSTYRFTQLFYSLRTAKLAALMLATSEFFFLFHNDIHTDNLLTANVIFAVWQFAEYFRSGKLKHILFGSAGIGLAMISKGPIGIFVPATAVIFHLLFKKQLKKLLDIKILAALPVLLLILFAGLKGIYNQFGWTGIRFFFWENNAGRITGSLKGDSNDLLFYFHTTLYIFLPWGIIFLTALFLEIRSLIKKMFVSENSELYTLGAIIFYWIVISFAKEKAPHYLMVLSPFMSVLSSKWLILIFRRKSLTRIRKAILPIQYLLILTTWILLLTLCIHCFPSKNILFWAGIFTLLLLTILKTGKSSLFRVTFRSVIAAIALNFALNTHLFPAMFTYQSTKQACDIFNDRANKKEYLNTYLSEHRELFFYCDRPGYYLYDSSDLQNFLRQNSNDWLYTNDKGLAEIRNAQYKFTIIESFKHRSISKLSLNFINPKTRDKSLKNMYLIKLDPT